ncbi:PPE family protein [Mycobacterium sp.]|uniref:PPE family protein n=1 Tax=Mycobacterium sp. TaxID=1785 RepID=UPI0031D60B0C
MFDFGALPPEINSARMYAGPGSGPMLAAAAAWADVTAALETFAAGYSAVLSELPGAWSGASSAAMAAASAPYLAWVTTTGQQVEQAANQARAAAAAYEAAFAATVPPTVVAANRALLATLVATNFFGQNTPAIAATETAYAAMWAQDAAAMYNYAGSASSSATLPQFDQPPSTTNSAGHSAQGAAVSKVVGISADQSQPALSQLLATMPQQLQSLASGGATNTSAADVSPSSIITVFSGINTITGPLVPGYEFTYATFQAAQFVQGLAQSGTQAKFLPELAAPLEGVASAVRTIAPQGFSGPVLAGAGRAVPIGGLSTPPNWAAPTPLESPVAEPITATETGFRALPTWAEQPQRLNRSGLPMMAQINHGGGRCDDDTAFRIRPRPYRIPRPALGG